MKKQKKVPKNKIRLTAILNNFIKSIKEPRVYDIKLNVVKGVRDSFFSSSTHGYINFDLGGSLFSDINVKLFSIYEKSNYYYYIEITTNVKKVILFVKGHQITELFDILSKKKSILNITSQRLLFINSIILYIDLVFSECTLKQNILGEQLSTYTLNYSKKVKESMDNIIDKEWLKKDKITVTYNKDYIGNSKEEADNIKNFLKKSYFTLKDSSPFCELYDIEHDQHS